MHFSQNCIIFFVKSLSFLVSRLNVYYCTVFQLFTWMIHLRRKLSLCSHPPLFPPSLKLVSTQEVQNSLSNIPLSKCFGLSTIWINCKRLWGLAGASASSEYSKNTTSLITENDSLCSIHSQQDMKRLNGLF